MRSSLGSIPWENRANAEIDDILITKDGYENLTTAPKGIDEMMGIING